MVLFLLQIASDALKGRVFECSLADLQQVAWQLSPIYLMAAALIWQGVWGIVWIVHVNRAHRCCLMSDRAVLIAERG